MATSKALIERWLHPIQEFTHKEASGGIVLLVCTVIALFWANSPWGSSYIALWDTVLTVKIADVGVSKPLLLWINDGLMAVFFFVVGLEIKREMLVGELSSLKQAALPIMAAIGGMVVPALIYFSFNPGGPGSTGWGIPMATDIAFALGILALLGSRAPLSLKIFLTALAIVDDLGAVLVIAIFYTAKISLISLVIGGGLLVFLYILNRIGVRNPLVYGLIGIIVWYAFLKSGVHATIAGVLLALTIPARSRINSIEFTNLSKDLLNRFTQAASGGPDDFTTEEQQSALHALEESCERVETPLQRLEHALHPWVAFFIMPVFALANAGVDLSGGLGGVIGHPVSLGIIFGLIIGKQVGIMLFSWIAVRTGLGAIPENIRWRQLYGVSWLAGIGFTMSLFIGGLAFADPALLTTAKVGILTASIIAGITGYIILRQSTGGAPRQSE